MAYIQFRGFEPDAEPTTPGVIRDASGMLPTVRGVEGAPGATNTALATLSASAVDAITLTDLADTSRTYAGTATALYEGGTTSWTKRGSGYNSTTQWTFAQNGDTTYAASKSNTIQKSTGDAFTDLTGAPSATIVEVVGSGSYFVFALDTSDATFGDSPDRWRNCALGNDNSWAPSIATQAATGRLTSAPGKITAGKRLGDLLVVYKDRAVYRGVYVGPPVIWDFELITDEAGCPSQRAVTLVDIDGFPRTHFFMGRENFYAYDGGSRPLPIGNPIREWFFNTQLNEKFREAVNVVHDRDNSRVGFFYPSQSGGGALDRSVWYNYRSQTWGPGATLTVTAPFEYRPSDGLTYDDLGNAYATYDDLPAVAYDSTFWITTANKVGVFNTSKKLQTLDGAAGTNWLKPHFVGRDAHQTFLTRVRPRFKSVPTSGNLYAAWMEQLGGTETTAANTIALSNGKFDYEREARWHAPRLEFTGDCEVMGLDWTLQRGSDE